ncbi:hypothetical protein [Nocardia flavorosea]|uniref:Crossover junction endodeoxyribonuclease RuvC n=1 Tax=Nocardia flavorosea TaxID=53429 RepID=A0A846YTT6_9NOCA|nr:hypothetical protein [Nocardia flavorosea]NKY60389.1 crossover junction endodeoxyribonuclease RuvC [Nocardia flavorosea]
MTDYPEVVGLDLSLTSTGIAAWDARGDIRTHRIRSKGAKTDTWRQRRARINRLADQVTDSISFDAFVLVEAPAYGSSTGSVWDRAGLWWRVVDTLHDIGCTVLPIEPTVLKRFATGKGNADKDAVLAAVVRRYLDIEVTGNDVADAVALLDIGMHLIGRPLAELPALNRSVLEKLSVPTVEAA